MLAVLHLPALVKMPPWPPSRGGYARHALSTSGQKCQPCGSRCLRVLARSRPATISSCCQRGVELSRTPNLRTCALLAVTPAGVCCDRMQRIWEDEKAFLQILRPPLISPAKLLVSLLPRLLVTSRIPAGTMPGGCESPMLRRAGDFLREVKLASACACNACWWAMNSACLCTCQYSPMHNV